MFVVDQELYEGIRTELNTAAKNESVIITGELKTTVHIFYIIPDSTTKVFLQNLVAFFLNRCDEK